MAYDPRRALIPVDPSSTEGTTIPEVVSSVPGVPLIGRPGGKARGFFGKLGRGILEGEYAFEPAPATLPFKPKTATNLLYLAQGILQGFTATKHAKEAAAERESIQQARKAQTEGEAENRGLRRREADIREAALTAEQKQQERENDAKLRDIAQKVATNSGGSVRYSQVLQALKSGNEQVLDAAVDAYSTMQGLGPAGQQFYASRIAQHRLGKGEPTPQDLARIAGEAADFVQKGLKSDEARANVDLALVQERFKKDRLLAESGGLSPAVRVQSGMQYLDLAGKYRQSASSEFKAMATQMAKAGLIGGEEAQLLMGDDADAQADVLGRAAKMKAYSAVVKRIQQISALANQYELLGFKLTTPLGTEAPQTTEPSVPDLSAPNAAPPTVQGLLVPGNIDMSKRPAVKNPDGSVSSVRSISIGTPQGEVLIPTVVGDRIVSNDEAIAEFRRTGKHLGIYDSTQSANRAAQAIHEAEAAKLKGNSAAAPLPPKKTAAARIKELMAGGKTKQEAMKIAASEGF